MLALVGLLTPATRGELEPHQRRTTVLVGIAWWVRMVLLRTDATALAEPIADTRHEAA